MLVLTRKKDQTVVMPGLGVKVTVLKIIGDKIRLGFDAPKDVVILRGELEPNADQIVLEVESHDEGN